MASASWHSLDPPLNQTILSVIENEFQFEKMTPVQVSTACFRPSNCSRELHLTIHDRLQLFSMRIMNFEDEKDILQRFSCDVWFISNLKEANVIDI